jgi:hypothetical protein
MIDAADKLDYERAAELRDRIKRMERQVFGMDSAPPGPPPPRGTAHSNPRVGKERPKQSPEIIGNARPIRGGVRGVAKRPAKQGRLKLTPD